MPSMLKKQAKVKNEITIINFSANGGSRKTFLLANPHLAFNQRVSDFLEFSHFNDF